MLATNTNAIGAAARKQTMGTHNNLQQRLDAYVVGDCNPRALADELLAHCAATPRSTWEVLALLDQYHRRGKLPLELHRTISQSIQRRALGVDLNAAAANGADTENTTNNVARLPISTARAVVAPVPPVAAVAPVAPVAPVADESLAHEILHLRKELQASRSLAAAYLEQLKSVSWQRPANDVAVIQASTPAVPRLRALRPRLARRWPARSVRVVTVAAFLFALGATTGLGERDVPFRLRPPTPVHVPIPGRLSLTSDTFLVQPGERNAVVSVARAEGTDGEISFVWWTRSAGARAGTDFQARAAARVTMPAGTNALQLNVPILRNPERRHTELFYVEIGKPQGGATLGDTTRATVFIMRP